MCDRGPMSAKICENSGSVCGFSATLKHLNLLPIKPRGRQCFPKANGQPNSNKFLPRRQRIGDPC
jgi:hypothetical protein